MSESVQVGPPKGTCPACGQRFRLVSNEERGRDRRWVLPNHYGDSYGDWGYCSGIAGNHGRMEPEDVR